MQKQDIKKISVGAALSIIGMFLRGFAKFFIVPMQIYYVGSEQFGIFITVFSVFIIITIIQRAGLHGLVKFCVENKNSQQASLAILLVSVYIPILLGILLSFFAYVIFQFFMPIDISNIAKETIYLLILVLPIVGAAEIPILLTLSSENNKYLLVSREISAPLVEIISLIFFIQFYPHITVIGVIVSYSLGQLTTYFTGIFFFSKINNFQKALSPNKFAYRFKILYEYRTSIVKWIKYCIPLALSGILLKITQLTDIIVIGFIVSPQTVTFYKTMLLICSLIQTIGSASYIIFSPMISRYYAKNDIASIRRLYINSTQINMIVIFPAIIAICINSESILSLFSFGYSSAVLRILIVGQIIFLITGGTGHILSMTSKSYLHFYNSLFATALNIIFCAFVIPTWEIIGAAVTSVTLTAFFGVVRVIQVNHFFQFTFWTQPIINHFITVVISCFFLEIFSYFIFFKSHLLITLLFFIMSYATYFTIYTLLFFNDVKTAISYMGKKSNG